MKRIFARTLDAARQNLLPGLLLQCLLLVFLAAYMCHEGTRHFLAQVESAKKESGYLFTFVSYVLSAALLPELLKVAFFQHCRLRKFNIRNFLTAAPGWGMIGVLVDFFYRCQSGWFGAGHTLTSVILKMLMDQFVFSPFLCTPLTLVYFYWRDAGFHLRGLKPVFSREFPGEVLTVQGAGWCIWIPGVCLVYSMPSGLQIPVAVLIQAFWVLIFTMVKQPDNQARRAR